MLSPFMIDSNLIILENAHHDAHSVIKRLITSEKAERSIDLPIGFEKISQEWSLRAGPSGAFGLGRPSCEKPDGRLHGSGY